MIKIFENLDLSDLDGEIWKDILDYDGDYQVSNLGRVKSLKFCKERILKQTIDKNGYCIIRLCKNGKAKNKNIHILIYETFYSDKLKLNECVHHKDKNTKNNYYKNLEKKTFREHMMNHNGGKNHPFFGKYHSEETKKKIANINRVGENNGHRILTNKKIIQIKMLFKLGFKNCEISRLYHIHKSTISNIKKEKSWSHIKI